MNNRLEKKTTTVETVLNKNLTGIYKGAPTEDQ